MSDIVKQLVAGNLDKLVAGLAPAIAPAIESALDKDIGELKPVLNSLVDGAVDQVKAHIPWTEIVLIVIGALLLMTLFVFLLTRVFDKM